MNQLHPFRGPLLALPIFLFIIISAGAPGIAECSSRPIDQVAVIVNDDVITEAELSARLRTVQSNLQKAGRGQLPPEQVLRQQVLESMIVERVQEQRAKESGIVITDGMLDQALKDIAQRNNLSVKAFRARMKKDGIDESEFMSRLRSQTAIQQLVNREVNSKIIVSKEDVDDYLRKRRQQQNRSIEYNVSHILLTTPQNASQAQLAKVMATGKEILEKLSAGAAFESIAASYSKDQFALEGGLIGWRAAGQLPELFVTALEKMKPGDVSSLLKSNNGFHILRLNKTRGENIPSFRVTQTHARHILLKTRTGISDSYTRQRLESIRQRIIRGEDFGKLARVYSEDVATAINDGDLGWVTPGAMVPSFEQAMNRLKPGQVSPIVASPYGYHVIKVLKRREHELGEEKLQADARRELHVRKAEEFYQTWIRRLRDQAYVEIID